ncbi:MAG: GntR family transcriptional regulator [Mycobacteriales bacterium]
MSAQIELGNLRRDSSLPLYVQIRDRLVDAITQGQLAPGARLPSEPELVARFGVGRPTVRQAIALLRQDGWVLTRRGFGTQVAASTEAVSLLGFDGLTRSLHARGISVQDTLLDSAVVSTPPLTILNVEDTGDWWTAVRLRRIPGATGLQPLCVEIDCFPCALCPHAPEVFSRTKSAAAVLQETYGFAVAASEVATVAVSVPPRWRSTLELPKGAPVLAMERVNTGLDGAVWHAVAFFLRTDLMPLVERLTNPAVARS